MQFIISNYGDSYGSLLTVCLDSLKRTHAEDKVTVLWDDMSDHEIQLLKFSYPQVEFVHQTANINAVDVHQRIPLKLRFWSEIAKKKQGETLVFLDSDTVVYKNIQKYTEGDFDFLFTHKDEQFPLNVGVVIVKNSPKVAEFLELWRTETEKNVADPVKLELAKQQNGAADQQALSDLMDNKDYSQDVTRKFKFGEIKFHGVPCTELNQTNSVPVDGGSYIYHFKGGWRPILLEEAGYTENRTEEDSAEMHAFWEQRYADINAENLKKFALAAATKHRNILPWEKIVYEERGILHSEMLLAISTMKELGVEVVIESGRARGQSTEMLALAFKDSNVPVVSIEWMRDDAAEFAEPRLAPYKHVELLYGDAHKVLPEIMARYPGKKVGVIFDGPKGEEAFQLFAKTYVDYPNIVVGFFHDCRRTYRRMINPTRENIYRFFDRLFFTDDEDYIKQFGAVDKMCEAKPGHITVHSWRPFTKGFWRIGSYGPTIGMVLPTPRDRVRATKNIKHTTMADSQPTSATMNLRQMIPFPVRKFIKDLIAPTPVAEPVAEKKSNEAVVDQKPALHYSMGWTTPEREQILDWSMYFLASSKLKGNYAEFGVWKGDTLATAYHFANLYGGNNPHLKEMQFFAFDSFEGFPTLKGDDNFPQFQKGGRACSIEDFMANMDLHQVDKSKLTATKGWFSETLKKGDAIDKQIAPESISLAYIDCDLYESTVDVLKFLSTKMMPGGIMIFDDWYTFAGHPLKGEQRAAMEFLNQHPEFVLVPFQKFHWHGNSFIFHKVKDPVEQKQLSESRLING